MGYSLIVLLFTTIFCYSSTVPQTLLEYLPTEANTLSSTTIETKQVQLPENAHLLAESLGIINQDIHLVGHNTTITPNKVERSLNNFQSDEPEAQTRYHSKCDNSVAKSVSKRLFMLNLQNSTVNVQQVTIDNNERESSIFLVESSTVLFEEGKLVSCGLESPFLVVNSEESPTRFGSRIVVSSSEIVWKEDAQPPLVDTLSTSAAVSVFGSGLRLDSKILSSGTGPLFSFGLHPSTGEIVPLRPDSTTTTHLSACSLVNMSSSCASNCESLPSLKFGSCVSQTLVGCSLSRSSNHQSGTGMLDINMGGSLLCQNTTFSHCTHTSNAAKTEQSKNYNSTHSQYTLPTGVTSLSFILCTFNTMTYSEKEGEYGGAAIYLPDVSSTLSVSKCFFHKCTVTGKSNDGGAIRYSSKATGTGLTVSDSSFTECASTGNYEFNTAGAIISEISGSSTISNCFFEKCWAKGRGGALYLINTPSTLSNCAFLECSTNTYGGGVLFRTVPSAKMTSVQFRACKANGTVSSRDVATLTMSATLLNSTSIQFCDSTSGSPNIYHCDTTSSDGSLIPQVGRSAAVVSSSVEIVGTTATVSMTMSEKIKGQMGVLLEGANVPRLIFLTFGTSTTASADFALSTTTILPTLASGKTYTLRSWSFPYGQAGVDGVTGSTANPTTASITISGYHFREGSYEMKVKTANQNELTISLTSPTLSSLSGTFGMSATESSKLRYAREYEVKCIVFNSTSLSKPSPLTFSIPYPSARLTNIAQVNSTDWLTLSFEGSGFVAESYIIALSGRDEDGQTQETTITLAPTSLTALPVVNMSLYPLDEASLRYGMEYTITSMISTDTFQNVVLDVTSFSTIPEPVRITTLTRSGYDELDKTAFFSVEGRVLVEGAKYRINVLSSSSAAFCFNFTASSTTGGEGSAILFSADPLKVELDYDTEYTVSRVEDAEGVELILHSTFTFSTIEEPGRVMRNGDAAALEDRNRTTIALVGHNMQVGTFSLELVNVVDETEKPVISARFDSATTGQASASLHPTVELKYGETYRLVKMTTTIANARPVHVEPSLSFIVTDEPSRLTEVGTVVPEDDSRQVKMALTGIKMTNGPFSLTLNNSKTLTATFEANGESGSMSAILFSQEESKVDLKYDTEYTVTGLTDKENKPTFFHSSLSFRTPLEPTRLVKLNVAKYDDDKTRIFVELIGSKLGTTGNYSVELSLDGSVKHTIDMSLTSESKWIGSALLYPSSSCELEYGKTYDVSNFTHTLNSVTSSRFFESNTLEIDAEPARITTLTRSGYDELDKTAFFSVEGRVLVEGESYRINVLSSSSAAFCFNFTASSTTGGEGSAILFSADPSKVELDYDTEYTVSRVEDAEGVELILHSTFTFSTIEEPGRVMRNGDAAALEDRNRTTIALVGHNMQVGTFSLELVNVVDETEKPVISARFDSATTGQASASLHPTVELKYGGTYRLVKMTTTMANARPVHVEPSLSFIVGVEPSRLTEIGTVVAEDSDRRVKIGLTGIKMTNGPFSLTLNNSKTLTATFEANGESGSMSAILFSQEESKVDLKYDTEYTVTGLTDKENKPTFFHSSLSFRTPAEPTRLVKLNVAKYDDDKTRIFVELIGSKLGTTGNYSVELSLDGDVIHTIDFSLTSESKWIGSALLYPSSSCELEYGKTYDVSNFTHTLNSVTSSRFFESNTLEIDAEPARITTLTLSGYDELDKTAFFSVEGRVLVEGAKYRINVLSSSSAAFCFNFTASSTTGGEGSAILFSADPSKVELDYDTAYTVSRVEDAEGVELILHSTFTFSTIEEPGRVMRNGDAAALEDRNRTTIALVGHNMQVGTFSLELVNVVDETEKPVISARFDSATTGQASASLHPTVELKYGETYRLVKMTTTIANARPVHVEPSLSFIVTDEPSRLTEVGTVVPEDDSRQVKMALTGIKMTNGPFSLTLNNSKTLTATFEANGESGSMSAILFSQEESKVDLKYDTEYTVTGLTDKENKPTFFHSSLSFRTPLEPTRLVKLNVAKYDDDKTRIFVELVGSKLGTTGNYSVELSLDGSVKHTIDMSLTSESKWIGSALLYPSSSCELEYGKTYDVSNFTHTLNSVTSSRFFESNTLEIGIEPARIESFYSATLNNARSMLTAKFTGREFKSEMGPVLLKSGTNTFESVGNVRFVNSANCEADFMVGDSEPGLVYDQSYSLATIDGGSSFFVNSDVSVRVPAPPLLTHVSFAPLNKLGISGLILFEGTDLESNKEYIITLEPSFSFTIRISASTSASSSPVLVGWNDSLPFGSTFKIASITPVDPMDGDVILKSLLSFNTSDRPTDLFIHLDSKSTDSSLFCGTFKNPCPTIESGWKIVNGLRFARPTLGIIDSTTLSSQLTVSEGMHVLLTHGSNSEPTLTIPSSATHSEGSGLIVVTMASLEIVDVDIVLDSPLSSFVLLSASSSGLLLKDGLITQKHQNTLRNSNSDICSWSTGIIQTIDCEMNITNNKFTRISAGVINMNGGNVTIVSSFFSNNSPPDSSFTSIRRNIHCSGQGEIDLQILPTGGDGSKEYPSAWMSLEECVLSGEDAPIDAPLFIPTLSKSSQSKLEKKAGHFDVQIEGKTLIPCGLFLEVFEVSKDKREGKSTNFELSQSSSTSFTETAISIKLPLSKLTSLDPNLEWRGRLVFGSDQITSESFVIQQNSQERMSQSVKDNMKWWLPLVIVIAASAILILFIVVFCYRRRHSKKEEGKKAKEEMDDTPEDLNIVKEEEYPNMASTILDPNAHHSSFIAAKTEKSDPTNNIVPEPSIYVIPGQVNVLKVEADAYGREMIAESSANAGDTLYNRLHGTGKDTPLDRNKMRKDLVNSLKQIYRVRPTASVFSKLSPFWVFLDKLDNLSVRLSDVGETELQGGTGQQGYSQNMKKVGDDGKRWEPPEQAECKVEVDTSKVTVFRLGLLLWEITTGQIPFGETDGVNAQRQVGIGVLPRMDEVRPTELVDLISDCLSLDPLNRPSLNDIEKRLSSIDSPTLVKENEAVHHPQRIEQVDHVFPGKPIGGNEAEEEWNVHEDHNTFSLSGSIE
ncbi:hypothetical protein BLNAU_945 [Blattamonas nauphoetae]|uniref:Protein kinase domain-containing protein n=1 Tax=Blattamonas nauphoetae TaxID=2049346 RepID=A0ABQ9YJF4_9EUKA|nr:hypothetical protein BLNAU_945 [Blattamonas nauphoetae]